MAGPTSGIVRQTAQGITLSMASLLAQSAKLLAADLPNVVTTMGKALALNALPKSKMRDTNYEIAFAAQRAVVSGWRARLPAATPDGSRKRLSGRLGPALADEANLQNTTDRVISFVDRDVLHREARHWYRVNYGARGPNLARSHHQAETFQIVLNGEVFGSFRDNSPPDSVSFIPTRVYWRGDAMWPKSREVEINQNGARAARFLDLGHFVVAQRAPRAYDEMWRTYLRQGGARVRERLGKKEIVVKGNVRLQRTGWSAQITY
jgi:hypothetical protein